MANTMNKPPPAYLMTRSGIRSPRISPTKTARPVATPCPATPPSATPSGDAAAESAIVAMKLCMVIKGGVRSVIGWQLGI